jgi:hypothetical protein
MARPVALTPMRQAAARQMRRTATRLDSDHPETVAGSHVRDAARVLEHGSSEGAKRHLDAAMEVLTPRNLYRHGITDDEGHATAKQHMHEIHRSRLAVQDIEDARTRNEQIADALKATRATIAQTDAAAAGPPERPAPPPHTPGGGAGPPGPAPPGKAPAPPSRPQVPAGSPPPPRRPPPPPQRPAPGGARLATELVGPKGYVHGWIKVSGTTFGAGLEPGSFEHVRAIDDLAERAGMGTGDPGSRSPTMRTALHNVARAVASRDIAAARVHMRSAAWGNRREASGSWTRDLSELSAQLGKVPPGVTGWRQREVNPLSPRGQHPGRYVSAALHPPANPTAGATVVGYATELSARTAMLERTPAPRGRPGGPGLYDVRGMGHTAYFQQVVKALIEKRGMPKDRAYRIAWGALRKWRRGGGGVHPEVRAAATGALAGEAARGAIARASHGHAAAAWEVAGLLVELAAGPADPLPSGLDVAELLIELAHVHFDPHQPRDARGRWMKAGGAAAVLTRPPRAPAETGSLSPAAQFLGQQIRPRPAVAGERGQLSPAARFLHQPALPPRPRAAAAVPAAGPPAPLEAHPARLVDQGLLAREKHGIISSFRDALGKLEAERKSEKANLTVAERKRRRLTLAWHGGLILAGAALAGVTIGVGAPAVVIAAAPVAPSLLQELIDYVKKLS